MNYIKLYERFYKPSKDIEKKLLSKIDFLLQNGKRGREFFNELDSFISNYNSIDLALTLVKGCSKEYVCCSGGFGDLIYRLYKEGKFRCNGVIVFNGKIQTNKSNVTGYKPFDFDLGNKSFVYIDDSYFSGFTVSKIRDSLEGYNSDIKIVSVVYDGSKIRDKNVKSFFRYYDNYN